MDRTLRLYGESIGGLGPAGNFRERTATNRRSGAARRGRRSGRRVGLRSAQVPRILPEKLRWASPRITSDEPKPLWEPTSCRLAVETAAPFVSTNVCTADDRPVAPPLQLLQAGGRRIAVLGVLSQKLSPKEVKVADPRSAILDALRRAKGTFDLAVVLAYLPPAELESLAADMPEVDLVIGGPTGQTIAPRQIGPTWLVSVTNKAKFVARFELAPSSREPRLAHDDRRVGRQIRRRPDSKSEPRQLCSRAGRSRFQRPRKLRSGPSCPRHRPIIESSASRHAGNATPPNAPPGTPPRTLVPGKRWPSTTAGSIPSAKNATRPLTGCPVVSFPSAARRSESASAAKVVTARALRTRRIRNGKRHLRPAINA